MIIMGIDSAHRNTGIAILDMEITFGRKPYVKDILYHFTHKTAKRSSILEEIKDLREVIEKVNREKLLYAVAHSVCEVAHAGRNFASSRNVGITWGICIGTQSEAFTQHQIKKMFKGLSSDLDAKQKSRAFVAGYNLMLSSRSRQMDEHQIDAVCAAIYFGSRFL